MRTMLNVLQMTHVLTERPEATAVEGVRLRTFSGPADIPAWLGLRERSFARQRLGVREWSSEDFQREFLAKPWWRPEAMWLAEVEGGVAGSVSLARRETATSSKPVVHWLMVAPRFRRRGLGRLLMATLEAAVWDAGERQVWLETHAAWREAAELYRALGYASVQ